jgi:hypothetical protein
MAKRRLRRNESTAYHEAGHAVVAINQRVAIHHASIVPGVGSLGHCKFADWSPQFAPDIEVTLGVRDQLERSILVAFAGGEAHFKLTGRRDRVGTESDRLAAIEYGGYVASGPEELSPYLTRLQFRTAQIISVPIVWKQIEAIANALLDSRDLSGRRVRQIARDSFQAQFEASLSR